MNWRIVIAVSLVCGGVAACGTRIASFSSSDKKEDTAASLERPDTPDARVVQVAWTSARASYCAFGMDKDKLKTDYLAYEQRQGANFQQMQALEAKYDTTFQKFLETAKGNPTYCSKQQIEEIRPDINRHLAGDYSPSLRKPQEEEKPKVHVKHRPTPMPADIFSQQGR